MAIELKVGDTVRLSLGADFASVPRSLQRWDEQIFTISKVKNINGRTNFRYYELKTCKSEKGLNFSISEDWIIPL